MRSIFFLSAFLISFFVSASAHPEWGPTGHRSIGAIAEKHLNHKTQKKIDKILKGKSLARVATFGDDIKSDPRYNKFKTWHYVNYPFGTKYINAQKNPAGDVVVGIERCIAILKDEHTSPEDQEFYLKLLVHLVGDLHQPMHAGLAEDKGGNDFQVRWFNRGTNLHRLWDSDMIETYNMSYSELANTMVEQPKEWIKIKQEGSPSQWIDESHALAEQIYKSAKIGEKLSYRYSYDHFSTVRDRLYLAGIRLARILNDIYS